MEQIQIIFFILGSFFGMEEGRIGAAKTTVTIHPHNQEVKIVQEKLFAAIEHESDKTVALEQWDTLFNWQETNSAWATELDSFSHKAVTYKKVNNNTQATITLEYSDQKDLSTMGIWYNKENKKFSVNHIPKQHLKTNDGILEGNYWVFKDDKPFSFTLELFFEFPAKDNLIAIDDLIKKR